MIAYIFLGKTGFIIKPLLEMKIATIPEFFSIKYTKGVRFYVGIIMAVGGILNFGVFPGVEANFIDIVTGIPKNYILLTMCVLLTIVLLYTLVGGMVSVIITNYIQYALLSIGMIFITVYGIFYVGWDKIINSVSASMGTKGFDAFFPTAFQSQFGIGFIIWQTLFWIALLVGWQAISMRLFSSKDSATGQKIYTLVGTDGFIARNFACPLGHNCICLSRRKSEKSLEALPIFIVKIIPAGLLGLIFAALLAASMSTYASYLLSWSSVVSQDIIGSIITFFTKRKITSKKQLLISRITMAFVMIFLIWWSLFHELTGYLYFYLNMTGMLFIPGVLICVVFGLYWKKATPLGAYLSITLGALLPMLYLVFPVEFEKYASEVGWGGFLIALIRNVNWFGNSKSF